MPRNLKVGTAEINAEARAFAQSVAGGYLRIYDGRQPASPDDPVTGQHLLAELRFGASVPEPADGVVILKNLQADPEARATGRASWFRCLMADGRTALLDGSCGTSDADLIMPTVQIQAGAAVSADSFIYGIPKS